MQNNKNIKYLTKVLRYTHLREIHETIKEGCYYPSHHATDFYHHYKEDIALMAEMDVHLNQQVFYFSILRISSPMLEAFQNDVM